MRRRFPKGSRHGGQFRRGQPTPPSSPEVKGDRGSFGQAVPGARSRALLGSFEDVQALMAIARRKSEVGRLVGEYERLNESERPTLLPHLSAQVLEEVGQEGREVADWADPEVAVIAAFMARREALYRKHNWKRRMGLLPYDDYPLNVRAFLPSFFR